MPISRSFDLQYWCKVHSLNSGKVSIKIQLKALPELSEWTLRSYVLWDVANDAGVSPFCIVRLD